MADSSTIQEFLIGIGFKVDQSSQSRFNQGIASANQNVAGLQTAVSRAGQAVQQLGQHFKAVSDEPARKFADATRRIGLGVEALRKGTVELGRTALATGGAFAAGILEVTKNFQELMYVAQRVGTTVEQLTALRFASEQAGKGADALTTALEGITAAISAGGRGMELWVNQFLPSGETWDKQTDKARGALLVMQGLVAQYRNEASRAMAVSQAAELGISEQMLRGEAARRPGGQGQIEFEIERYDAARKRIAESRVNLTALATASDKLWQSITGIGQDISLIWAQALEKTLPIIDKIVTGLASLVNQVKVYNTTHPDAAVAEAWVAAASGVLALAGALKILTGQFILFNPYLLAFAAAAALAMTSWHPWIAAQLDELTKAIQSYDFAALGAALVKGLFSFTVSDDQADKIIKDPMLDALDRLVKAAGEKGKEFLSAFAKAAWDAIQNDPDIAWLRNLPGLIFGQQTPAEAERQRQSRGAPAQGQDRGRGRGGRGYGGLSAAELGDLGVPGYQGGGIVRANLHEGEMVLPVPISRGLQALIKAGSDGAAQLGMGRGLERLGDWLGGLAVPRVAVQNWDDMIREQQEAQIGQPNAGQYGPPAPGSSNNPLRPTDGASGLGAPDYGPIDRSKFAAELEAKPELRNKILRIAANEQGSNPQGTQAVIESLMNRVMLRGTSLEKESRWTGEGGYYAQGRMGRGALENPKQRAILEESLKRVLANSNISNYATDNASGALAARERASGAFRYRKDFGGETFFAPGTAEPGLAKRWDAWQGQLDRMKNTTIAPSASTTRGAGGAAGGDKNVEVHVTNNITIHGDGDPNETTRRYALTHKRLHADLIRNLKPALA